MFERYTEKARRIIFFARYEAGSAGAEYIEPEHILLGILREEKQLVDNLMAGQGGSLQLMLLLEQQTKRRTGVASSVDMPLSHAGKRVLAYAAEDSEKLGDKYIGSGHLLLGLLREPSRARAALEQFNITPERVREQMPEVAADHFQNFYDLRRRFSALTAQLNHEHEPAFKFLK